MTDDYLKRASRELSDYIRSEPDLADAFGMNPAKPLREKRASARRIRMMRAYVERHPDQPKARAMLDRLIQREGETP